MISSVSIGPDHDAAIVPITVDGRNYSLVTVGKKSYISDAVVDWGSIRSNVMIGRYTSIAHRVVFEIGLNHNHHLVSSYPFHDFAAYKSNTDFDTNHFYENNHYQIFIGNDVWIGEGVKILGGVHIGDGAVIGMGAVVTRDVPPYAVAVGNPAKVVKYRFNEETIAKLMHIRWWNWDETTINNRQPEMDDPVAFADRYYYHEEVTASNDFTNAMDAMKQAGGKIYYFVVDFDAPYPLWDKVLYSFRKSFMKNSNQLLIVEVSKSSLTDIEFYGANSVVKQFCSECPGIIKIETENAYAPAIFTHSGIYVSGNDVRSLPYLDKAVSIGIEVRSGCDWQSGLFEKANASCLVSDNNELNIISNEVFVKQNYHTSILFAEKSIQEKDYEQAMIRISACGDMLYKWNQSFTDEILENQISEIASATNTFELINIKSDNTSPILFYDDFGLDTRGLALIYVKALVAYGKDFIYLTTENAKGKQPEIDKVLSKCRYSTTLYFRGHNGSLEKLRILQRIFADVKPSKAFLYTYPHDVSGIIAFMQLSGKAVRYQVNLTDHAFWLGRNAFDYCVEFRNVGASISTLYRKIPRAKEVLLPYYPAVDRTVEFQGFPFESTGKKVLFSGGSLYKTIDKDLTYYHIVDMILKENDDTIFLYAGYGDDNQLKRISRKYPGRFFHIGERKDLFQLMQHVTLYLDTYPIGGGLMIQYAAAACRIPMILYKDPVNNNGVLINQENRMVFYKTAEALIEDAKRLLSDDDYRKQREQLLQGSVMSENEFNYEISRLIEGNRTDYSLNIRDIDVSDFIADYKSNFDGQMCL